MLKYIFAIVASLLLLLWASYASKNVSFYNQNLTVESSKENGYSETFKGAVGIFYNRNLNNLDLSQVSNDYYDSAITAVTLLKTLQNKQIPSLFNFIFHKLWFYQGAIKINIRGSEFSQEGSKTLVPADNLNNINYGTKQEDINDVTRKTPNSFNTIDALLIQKPYSQKLLDQWYKLAEQESWKGFGSKLLLLENIINNHPQNSLLYQDYLTLLSWDEQHKKAIEKYKKITTILAKKYFLNAMAVSARTIDDKELALNIYQELIKREPDDIDWIVAELELLQELSRADEAIDKILKLAKPIKNHSRIQYTLAGAYRQVRQGLMSLNIYDDLLIQQPKSEDLLRQKALTLKEEGLPFLAMSIVNQHPKLFQIEQIIQIYSDMNTYHVRLSVDDTDKILKKANIIKGLEVNKEYLKWLDLGESSEKKILNAKSDRFVLLHLNKNYQQIIDEYEIEIEAETESSPVNFPIYALNIISSSYLALKRPADALKIAKHVLSKQTNHFNANINAYFSELELENFSNAKEYISYLEGKLPIWFYSEDGRTTLENMNRGFVELLSIMHIAYKNRLNEAQDKLFELLDKAPANNNYRVNLATIFRWRGWIQKAQEQLNLVANSDNEFLPLQTEQANLFLEQKEYSKAEELINKLSQIDPKPDSVKVLEKRWGVYDSNILSVNATQSDSTGSNFSSKDQRHSVKFYSQPIANNWRVLGFYDDTFSRFFEDSKHITKHGVGLDYRSPKFDVELDLFHVEGLRDNDFSINFNWALNDYWSIQSEYESFSEDTPVRAFNDGVVTESFEIGGLYDVNEKQQFGAKYSLVDFSDGNKRDTLFLHAYQPLFDNEHHRLSVWEYLYLQRNSLDSNRSYYNPKDLASISAALDYTGILKRKYDFEFNHSARLGVSFVNQSGFKAKPVIDITYLHNWYFSKKFHLYYGVGFKQGYYDGKREHGPNYQAGLEYKF